jgi:formylglycine-generating enzyme required for sulfatase activity
MHFRCPNCRQPIDIECALTEIGTIDLKCPSCNSRLSLAGDPESTVVLPIGEMVAHFQIVRLLGEGAFGTVYEAQDTELGRRVAIKMPRPGRRKRDSIRKFVVEAQAAAAIRHPHVVTVYEVGVHEEEPYIASELIDGVPLSGYRQIRAPSWEQIASLMSKVLSGVQALHDHDMIHRDLKPGNILIDRNGEPHITDFGLAKDLSTERVTLTADGRLIGTLQYMSPEQAAGDVKSIDRQSDIFACGVILYEMLTGQLPFQATDSQTLTELIRIAEPQPPKKLDKSVPKDLETICLKAIAAEKSDRYQSASDFADDLQRYVNRQPILAKPPHLLKRVTYACGQLPRKHPREILVGFLLVTVLAFGLGYTAFLYANRNLKVGVPVVITTEPAATEIWFERYDEAFRVPRRPEFEVRAEHGETVWLRPGLYKVQARDSDGRFHEVWRTVPESTRAESANRLYPHTDFLIEASRDGDESGKVVALPAFRLFRDSEVEAELVTVSQGEFEMGTDRNAKDDAGLHLQEVTQFLAGVNEVSYADFRRVMRTPHHRGDAKSYGELISAYYSPQPPANEAMPVTGYPRDVAILYAELVGGRLPTNVEYEYLATSHGNHDFPSGDAPAVPPDANWRVLSVDAPTNDLSPEGIRNLYASVAEYTDSTRVNYIRLYPDRFEETTAGALDPKIRALISQQEEIRGAPAGWVLSSKRDPTRDVRQRLALPPGITVERIPQLCQRVGWRIYRSHHP